MLTSPGKPAVNKEEASGYKDKVIAGPSSKVDVSPTPDQLHGLGVVSREVSTKASFPQVLSTAATAKDIEPVQKTLPDIEPAGNGTQRESTEMTMTQPAKPRVKADVAKKPTAEETAAKLKKIQADAVYNIRRNIAHGGKHRDRNAPTTALEVLDRIRNAQIGEFESHDTAPATPLPTSPAEKTNQHCSRERKSSEVRPSEAASHGVRASSNIIGNHFVLGPSSRGKGRSPGSQWAKHEQIQPVQDVEDNGSNAWGSEVPHPGGSADSNVPVLHGQYIPKVTPEYDVQIADFDGGFAPAPIDWEGRPIFDNRQQWYSESIEDWITTFNSFSREGADDVKGRKVDPKEAGFLEGTAQPDGLSMQFPDYNYLPCLTDPSDQLSMKHKMERAIDLIMRYKALERKMAMDAKDNEIYFKRAFAASKPAPNPHKPKANIYLRPAERNDAAAIKDVLNWYIVNTARVVDTQPYSVNDIRHRISNCARETLPCLVAIERGSTRRRFNNNSNEKIVGYALATDFVGRDTQDKYTAEIELFVHPDHVRQGIGKCLLDKLLQVCDTGYIPRSGYMFTCDKDVNTNYGTGGNRYLTNVIFVLRFLKSDPKDYQWTKEWLMRSWDFKESALLEETGVKFHR